MGDCGFSRRQAREIILAGVRGFENKKRRAKADVRPLHRTKKMTQLNRGVRKLMEKATWYQGKKGDQGEAPKPKDDIKQKLNHRRARAWVPGPSPIDK